MTLIYRQDDNGNQPPAQGGGDQTAGNGGGQDTQSSGGGQQETGQASLPFVDPTSTTASVVTPTSLVIPPTNAAVGIPVGSGVASGDGFISALTLTVDVPTITAVPTATPATTSGPPTPQPVTTLGLSLPVLIGIIAGVFAFLVIVLVIIIVLYRRAGKKRRAQNSLHSHDAEGFAFPHAGGSKLNAHELTPPPTPAPLSHKALMQEKQRDLAALDALVSALDQSQARSGAQRYDPNRSGPGAGSVAKLKASSSTASKQNDFDWDDEDESGEFEAKRQKRRTVDELPDADVFRAALAHKAS